MKDILSYCRPENVGVHPSWVEEYIDRINRAGKVQHSFLMMRGTSVFAEGYYKPFHRDWLHRMYSVSKTFVSAAIGMLADEGRLSLDDTILSYFPEQDNGNVHPLIREMTIRHMLMMATCHASSAYRLQDRDWIQVFFHPHLEPDHPAGTEFRYDTSATHTLCALIERLTGKTFLAYLKDKALREFGFSEAAWCVESPEGNAWGGSGVECTTRDLARFAQLFAHGGVVGGKRYLSEDYVKEATSCQIDNMNICGGKPDACYGHGYGYQIWRVRDGAFAFLGMGGQLAVILPQKDLIFVCTSDMQGDADGYHGLVDLFFETVADRVTESEIPMDDTSYERLQAILGALEVNIPFGANSSPLQEKICAKFYKLEENSMQMSGFSIEINGNSGLLTYETSRGRKRFPFCFGRYADTVFPEDHYSGKRIGEPANRGYRCLNAAVWEEENVLLVRSYVIDDYFGNMSARFTFTGNTVHLQITKTAEGFLDEYVGSAYGTYTAKKDREGELK